MMFLFPVFYFVIPSFIDLKVYFFYKRLMILKIMIANTFFINFSNHKIKGTWQNG